MSDLNPECCGSHCRSATAEVRVYPLGAGGNLILCQVCAAHENKSRHLKGIHDGRPEEWPQVNWFDCEPYPEKEKDA